MPEDANSYPSPSDLGAELIYGAAIESLEIVETSVAHGLEEEGHTLDSETGLCLTIRDKLARGEPVSSVLFGIHVEIVPVASPPQIDQGGDSSGVREPRRPHPPSDSTAISIEKEAVRNN